MLQAIRKNDKSTLQSLLSEYNLTTNNSNNHYNTTPQSSTFNSQNHTSSTLLLGKSPRHSNKNIKKKSSSLDPNERDALGYPLLHVAIALENKEIVELLLRECPRLWVNSADLESGYTALHKVILLPCIKKTLNIKL